MGPYTRVEWPYGLLIVFNGPFMVFSRRHRFFCSWFDAKNNNKTSIRTFEHCSRSSISIARGQKLTYQEDQVHSCPNVHSSARPNFWYSRTENGPCNPAIGTRRAKHHPWAFSKPGRCGIIGQFPNHLGIEDAYWPFPRRCSQWTKCRRDRNI